MSMWQYIPQCQKVGGAIIRRGAVFGGNTVCVSLTLGKRKRAITCMRSDDVPVSLSYCGVSNNEAVEEELCSVECLVDCEITPFGPWSSCSQTCGLESRRTRWSLIKIPANGLGRQCPKQEDLKQVGTIWKYMCKSPLTPSKGETEKLLGRLPFKKKVFVRVRSMLRGHWYPLFQASDDSAHGFQSQGGFIITCALLSLVCNDPQSHF